MGAILTSVFFLLGCWGLSDFQQVGESAGALGLFWVLKEGDWGGRGLPKQPLGRVGVFFQLRGVHWWGERSEGGRSELGIPGMKCACC